MFDLPGDPTLLIIGVLIVLLSLVVIFSVLISSYNFLVSRVLRLEKKQKKDDAKIRANAYKEASEILDKARKQSMRSIKQAEKEATKILRIKRSCWAIN
jgi:sensor histidine kinase YesM